MRRFAPARLAPALWGVAILGLAGAGAADAARVAPGPKGWELATEDGRWRLAIDVRFQFRFSGPFDENPDTLDDFGEGESPTFVVNRGRLKLDGTAYRSWLAYFAEYDLPSSRLLDFRVMVERDPRLMLMIGQRKARFSRERVISSGKQQLADRSLLNRPYTVDRQEGISAYGRLAGGGPADVSYWLGVFTGMGRGGGRNDDGNLMWLGRVQWNPLGRELGFSGSDPGLREEPAGLVALAAVTNRSPYTRFSSAGGGQLDGFEDGIPGRYRVNQLLLETAFAWRGFSWQQELHHKEIDDKVAGTVTKLAGVYLQAGTFPHVWWEAVPRGLEIAGRWAAHDPDRDRESDRQEEVTLAANLFLAGHRNKLTAEIWVFDFEETPENVRDGTRFRLQWDISLGGVGS